MSKDISDHVDVRDLSSGRSRLTYLVGSRPSSLCQNDPFVRQAPFSVSEVRLDGVRGDTQALGDLPTSKVFYGVEIADFDLAVAPARSQMGEHAFDVGQFVWHRGRSGEPYNDLAQLFQPFPEALKLGQTLIYPSLQIHGDCAVVEPARDRAFARLVRF